LKITTEVAFHIGQQVSSASSARGCTSGRLLQAHESGGSGGVSELGHALVQDFGKQRTVRLQSDLFRIVEAIVTSASFLGASELVTLCRAAFFGRTGK
jgi:hypothetical protein